MPDDEPKYARITMNVPIRVWREVEAMAAALGIAKTEALRRCISTEVFRRQVEAEGGALVVRHANGEHERVHFDY